MRIPLTSVQFSRPISTTSVRCTAPTRLAAARGALLAAVSLFALLGFVVPAHSGVTYTVAPKNEIGDPLTPPLYPGRLITLDITLRSDTEPIFGILASVSGYDPNVVRFVSGSASPQLFSSFCTAPSSCFGGFSNLTVDLMEEDGRVIFANSVSGSGVVGTGENDSGVDSNIGGPQARVTFEVIGLGFANFNIGSDPSLGEVIITLGGTQAAVNNANLEILILPEPSTTLLVGMGLACLSGRRTRFRNDAN